MVVVMSPDATDEDIAARRRAGRERRRRGVRQQGRGAHDHRPGRRHRLLPPPQPAHPARASPTCTGSPTPTSWSAASTTPSARRSGSARRARRCRSARTRSPSSPARAPSRRRSRRSRPRRWRKAAGATILRGGAFKPRTSPYAFQGLGVAGLEILADVARGDRAARSSPRSSTPATSPSSPSTPTCSRSAPATWPTSGCSRPSASAGKPVLLKRGMTATIEEWLMAAEYIAQRGNLDVVLCERGIRTFEPATRNTLDISAVPVVQATSHLPIIVDPSHAAGPQGPRRAAVPGRDRGRRRRRHRRRAPRPRDRALRRPAGAATAPTCASSPRPYAGCPPLLGRADAATLIR